MARIPRPATALMPLLGASVILAVAWSFLVPPFHDPDEDQHYVYVQSLAEHHARPPYHGWTTPGAQLSPAVRLAEEFAGGRVQFNDSPPRWDPRSDRAYRAALHSVPAATSTRVDSAAAQGGDPPLYHLYAAVAYAATPSDSAFTRLYAMRAWSALLIVATVMGSWLLAGEIFARNRLLQLITAGTVGLQPMVTFMSGSLNPDAAAYGCSTLLLWLGVRVVRRGLSTANLVALVAVYVAAALTKTVLLSLGPALVLAVLVGARRHPRGPARLSRRSTVLAAAIAIPLVALGLNALSPGALGFVPEPSKLSRFGTYLWQFYLPALPFQEHFPGLPGHAAYTFWFKGAWGAFAQNDVRLGPAVYAALALASAAVLLFAGVALLRRRARVDYGILAFFGVALGGFLLVLHVAEYDQIIKGGWATNQGRYLLPFIALAGIATAAAVSNLPRSRRAAAAAVVLGAMLVLNVLSLGVTARFFYG